MVEARRVTLRTVRESVEGMEMFFGPHMFGVWYDADFEAGVPWRRYAVFSYGIHWPLLVVEETGMTMQTCTWYVNAYPNYSKTTARHMSSIRPRGVACTPMETHELQEIIAVGYGRALIESPFTSRFIGTRLRAGIPESWLGRVVNEPRYAPCRQN